MNLFRMFLPVLTLVSAAIAAPNSGYIKSLRFVTGENGSNYAVISTSAPAKWGASDNYIGGENLGVPYTVLVLPKDPVLMGLSGSSLERAKSTITTKFYYIDVAIGANSGLCKVPGIPPAGWVNVVSTWYVGE